MKPRTKLALIILLGLIIRFALYDHIVVNYDDGLYLHDAYQITQGNIPVVDYPSRSPVFHVLLAIYYYLPFDIITNYRLVQYAFGIITTLGVYGVTARLSPLTRLDYNHITPLLAAALYWLNPFVIGYGSWVKTEILATGFVLIAIYLLTYAIESRETVHTPFLVLTGLTLSVGVLIRRSVLVAGFAIGLYILLYYRHNLLTNFRAISAYSLSAILGTFTLYVILAKGNVTTTWLLFEVHILDLVRDGGFGAFEYVRFTDLSDYLTQDTIRDWPLFRKFGPASVTRMEQIMRYNPVFIIPLLGYFRGYMCTYPDESDNKRTDTWITLVLIGLFGLLFYQHADVVVYEYLQNGVTPRTTVYSHRILQGAVLFTGTILLWFLPRIPYKYATKGHRSLVWFVFILVPFSYIARNRVIYSVYWLDVLPYAAVLVALGLVYWYHNVHVNIPARKIVLSVGIVVIVLASVSAPVTYSALPEQPTPDYVHDIRSEVTKHSNPGDTVLTAQPMFVLQNEGREVALDLGRSYYFIREAPGSPPGEALSKELERVVCESSVVVDGPGLKVLTTYNPGIESNIRRCHREVYRVGFGGGTGDERVEYIRVLARKT